MARLKRTVGYCTQPECECHSKGTLFPGRRRAFYCPRCQQAGQVEPEKRFITGDSDIFNEVRIEYQFDPTRERYRKVARVRDESILVEHNLYTLRSPFIRTEEHALKAAEIILNRLNRHYGPIRCADTYRTVKSNAILTRHSEALDEIPETI